MRILTPGIVVAGGLLGLLIALSTATVSHSEFLHPSTWDPDKPQHRSDFVETTVWGWPLYWAVDHPLEGRREKIDLPDEVLPARLVADIAFCVLLLFYVRGLVLLFRDRDRPRQLFAATLLAPLTGFWFVQLLLPLMDVGGPRSTRDVMLHDSPIAMAAGVVALVGLVVIGLPLTWLLRRFGLFRPSIVFAMGALLAIFPFGKQTLDFGSNSFYEWALTAIIAIGGGLVALTFRAFSGLGRKAGADHPAHEMEAR